MSTPAFGARGAVASALTAAAGWLVEPADPVEGSSYGCQIPAERVVVAVVGLAPGCGATAVARGLGAELAARDEDGACVVTTAKAGGVVALGLPAAGRLSRSLAGVPGVAARACGRLCLAECCDSAALAGAVLYEAPLVLDVASPQEAWVAAALADSVILVAAPRVEPALAAVVADSLSRGAGAPLVVLNRVAVGEDHRWSGRAGFELPESRMGAQLALAGREPRGELGRAIARLADALAGAR